MEDEKTMQDCGCQCETCAVKGDHEHCSTGLCMKQHKEMTEEE